MLKVNLHSLVRPKIFWPSIIILLIVCITLYILKEKEKALRIKTENELTRTIEVKRVVENHLVEAKKEITAKDEQIKLTLDKLEKEIIVRKEAEAQLISLANEKQALEEKVEKLTAALPKSIELEKIVVKSTRGLTGNVLTLDKEHGLVGVNLGSANNLKLGDVLSVYRDDKFIGKVQVEKIEEKTSATVILTPWKSVEFKENDVVKKL
ncbi:MAG: hypothetical protein Q8O30_01080 [Candidatus Omnitrophota bacterium]|nr:hypothetical protein [Candidatus Omnitrophota bacterium]